MMELNPNEFILLWGMYGISILATMGIGYAGGWFACRKRALIKMKEQRTIIRKEELEFLNETFGEEFDEKELFDNIIKERIKKIGKELK